MQNQPLNFKEIGFRRLIGSEQDKQLSVIWRNDSAMDPSSIQVFEIIDGKKISLDPAMVQPNKDLMGYVFSYSPSSAGHEYEIQFKLSDGTDVEHKVLYESGNSAGDNVRLPGTEGDVMVPVKPA